MTSAGGAARCPGCGAGDLEIVYEVERVPVHSNILVADRDEALAYPTGRMALGLCGACALLANAAFDPALVDYAEGYEETQGYSPRFRLFLDELVEDLARRHHLAGGRVLEIGCGKGEFLAALCRRAECTGIGIDPAYVARGKPVEADVTFLRELYSDALSDLTADLVCCRHTLEHVADPVALLTDMGNALGGRRGAALFIEVPAAERILSEGAFWDVYYEHRSYFTAGSLRRTVARAGLDTTDVRFGFDHQYLLLEARAASGAHAASDRDLEETVGLARSFGRRVRASLAGWTDELRATRRRGGRAVLWGAGSKAVGFLTSLGSADAVGHVVDVNPHKQGTYLPGTGQEIVAPADLTALRPDLVVVMNPVYLDEIRADLDRLGVEARVLALEGGAGPGDSTATTASA